VAHHREEAGDALEAARWHRHAAVWVGLSQPAESFGHWRKVRELTDGLSSSAEADELGALARVQLITAGARIGAPENEMSALYREGIELARRSGSRGAQAWLLTAFANYLHQTTGVVGAVLPDLEEAVALSDEVDDIGLQITARYNLLIPSFFRNTTVGLERLEGALERLGAPTGGELELFGFPARPMLQWMRVIALAMAGRFGEAAEAQALLERATEGASGPFGRSMALGSASQIAIMRGDAARGIELGIRSLNAAEEYTQPAALMLSRFRLGEAYRVAGDPRSALEQFEAALRAIRDQQALVNFEVQLLASTARARAEAGDPERALAEADEAIRLDRERDPGGPGWSTAHLARAVALLRARGGGAREAIEAELNLAQEIADLGGMEPYAIVALEVRAELARTLGDEGSRARWLSEARRRSAEIGATGHAERLGRELD
jgi:tetratricopeptide (TPR) repeat protein